MQGRGTCRGLPRGLFGHYVADAGTIEVFGKPLSAGSPYAAIEAGVGMVHQHFTLADNLTVLDNIILGTKALWAPRLGRAKARQTLLEASGKSGLAVEPDRLVGDLSVGERQRVEILKALYRGAKILILDEPTAVLSPQEIDQLFDTIGDLVNGGMSVIFISHKLKEVMSVSDRVMVLRQGRVVSDQLTQSTAREELAHLMVGREIPKPKHVRLDAGESVLELRGIDVVDSEGKKVLNDAYLGRAERFAINDLDVGGVIGPSKPLHLYGVEIVVFRNPKVHWQLFASRAQKEDLRAVECSDSFSSQDSR